MGGKSVARVERPPTTPIHPATEKNTPHIFTRSQYLRGKGAKLILASHAGRPKGKVVESLRMGFISKTLADIMGVPVQQAPDCLGEDVEKMVGELEEGGVMLLENVRFHAGEQTNDPGFCKNLVSALRPDVYVNDAFGTVHRAHASTAGVRKFIQGPKVVRCN